MEQIRIEELVEEVRITIDENREEYSYFHNSSDNMELNEIIRTKLLDAIRFILESCPVSLLSPIAITLPENGHIKNDDGTGAIILPEDFLRLVSFQLSTWNRAVVNVAEEGSNTYLIQRNRYTRGTPIKPICVFSHNDKGKRTMEYFTAGKDHEGNVNHSIRGALYIPTPSIVNNTEQGDSVYIPRLLRFAIINYCAGLTETSRGNPEAGQVFFTVAANSLTRPSNS